MTQGIPSLKVMASQVVIAQQQPVALPTELIDFLSEVVDLSDIEHEPAAIWADLNGFLNTIIHMSPEDDEATSDDQTQVLYDLIARCDRVLQLIPHALEFIQSQDDEQWREYYTAKCTEAIDSVNDCKANCEQLLSAP
jgi:hypothetical protein